MAPHIPHLAKLLHELQTKCCVVTRNVDPAEPPMLPWESKHSNVHPWRVLSHLDPLTVEADGGDGVEELVELHHVQGGGLTGAIEA